MFIDLVTDFFGYLIEGLTGSPSLSILEILPEVTRTVAG
jgi:hypothetical protein